MSYRDDTGALRGFAVAVLNEAARREQIVLEWKPASLLPDQDLLDGRIDLIAGGVITPERQQKFFVSPPWWSIEMIALTPASGPIRRDTDLEGRPLSAPISAVGTALAYKPLTVIPERSATTALQRVCVHEADAAIIARMFLREVLYHLPPPCRNSGMMTIDLPQHQDLALVARRERSAAARLLRNRIDEITQDGTLVRLAAQNPPISTPNATLLSDVLRAQYQRRSLILGVAVCAGLLAVGFCLQIWLQLSRRRLSASHARLERSAQEQERAIAALRTSEQRFRALLENTSDWIWEVDAEGRYTFSSPQAQSLLGYSPQELLGMTMFDLAPPDEAARLRGTFADFARAGQPFLALEKVNRHKSGAAVIFESNGMPVLGEDGRLRGYRGVDRDVTRRRRQEQALAARAAISRALVDEPTFDEKLQGALRVLAELCGMQIGVALCRDELGGALQIVATWQKGDWPEATLRAAIAGLAPAPSRCLERLMEDSIPQTRHLLGCAGACEIAGCASQFSLSWSLCVPVRSGEGINGGILLLGQHDCQVDAPLQETLAQVGLQIGEFLARERARAEVRRFVSASPAVLYALRVTPEGLKPAWVSENLPRLTGHTPSEPLSKAWWIDNVHPDDRERLLALDRAPNRVDHQTREFRFRRADGTYIWLSDERRLLRDDSGEPAEVVGAWFDITQRIELERQLSHGQKMEAIGSLAAGVAHDFNNLLTVINGYSNMALLSLPPADEAYEQIEQVVRAGERAAGLTRQLLVFSRRQSFAPQVVALQSVVAGMSKMLRRLIGDDVQMVIENASTGNVLADPGQLEQVLMNLVVNARDAMPKGGTLSIMTSDHDIPEGHPGLAAGHYGALSISDTGIGMDAQTRLRIFDPFFTTKDPGRGTGLGLSTVYGIVRQSGGLIEVESQPGRGSTFRILLPLLPAAARTAEKKRPTEDWSGNETILVVEDNETVRRLACEVLRARGYRVLDASHPGEAILIHEQRAEEHINLLLSDLMMPHINGVELAKRLLRDRPDTRVLFMTGFADNHLEAQARATSGTSCMQKPFSPSELARRVRQTLDTPATAAVHL